MDNGFRIIYDDHEKAAKQLLIETGIPSGKEPATMAGIEVEGDYLFIPKDKVKEFNKIISAIALQKNLQ